MAVQKFCHDLRTVNWGTIMYEMITLMIPPECAKMLFWNVDKNASFHCCIFRKEIQISPAQISTGSFQHHYTARVFCGFNRKFWVLSWCITRTTHHLWDSPHQCKSALINITFLHAAAVQCRYFWQKFSLFFFITAVSMGFLTARRHDRPRFFWSRWRIVLVETLRRSSWCLFFNSNAVIDGYDVNSCFKSFSVFGEVFLGAPEPDFLFGIIQDGNNAADLFNWKIASLETPMSLATALIESSFCNIVKTRQCSAICIFFSPTFASKINFVRPRNFKKTANFDQFHRPTIHQAVKLNKPCRTMGMR